MAACAAVILCAAVAEQATRWVEPRKIGIQPLSSHVDERGFCFARGELFINRKESKGQYTKRLVVNIHTLQQSNHESRTLWLPARVNKYTPKKEDHHYASRS